MLLPGHPCAQPSKGQGRDLASLALDKRGAQGLRVSLLSILTLSILNSEVDLFSHFPPTYTICV